MAYDADLAERIRGHIGEAPDLTEQKMFGGLAFLMAGNMAVSASGRGGILVRVDPAESDVLLATTAATLMVMGGRSMDGWLHVAADEIGTEEQLGPWVERGVAYARSLGPKDKKTKKTKK